MNYTNALTWFDSIFPNEERSTKQKVDMGFCELGQHEVEEAFLQTKEDKQVCDFCLETL